MIDDRRLEIGFCLAGILALLVLVFIFFQGRQNSEEQRKSDPDTWKQIQQEKQKAAEDNLVATGADIMNSP